MTDERIDIEFDREDCGPFDSPISAYKAGFRAAERLAKIEVLEEVRRMFDNLDSINPVDYSDSFAVIDSVLSDLKGGQ